MDSCFCGYLRDVLHNHDELVEYKCLAVLLTLDGKLICLLFLLRLLSFDFYVRASQGAAHTFLSMVDNLILVTVSVN